MHVLCMHVCNRCKALLRLSLEAQAVQVACEDSYKA